MADIGLLITAGVIVSMGSGRVTDNDQGIAETGRNVEGEAAQALTKLDATGNTTKTITNGIVIAAAVLAETALFGSFPLRLRRGLCRWTPPAARRSASLRDSPEPSPAPR
jgi:K(+)-stimulated pyrophosphate-energized sodium pump